MRFEGTDTYVATDDLKLAVNAALALERPLLVETVRDIATGSLVLGDAATGEPTPPTPC